MTIEQLCDLEGPWRSAGRGGSPLLRAIPSALALAAIIFGFSGCGEHGEPPEMTKQAVKFDDVPEPLRAAARKAIPGINFNEAWKNLDRQGKHQSYEIRGKNAANGQIREVRVSLTGEILEKE